MPKKHKKRWFNSKIVFDNLTADEKNAFVADMLESGEGQKILVEMMIGGIKKSAGLE